VPDGLVFSLTGQPETNARNPGTIAMHVIVSVLSQILQGRFPRMRAAVQAQKAISKALKKNKRDRRALAAGGVSGDSNGEACQGSAAEGNGRDMNALDRRGWLFDHSRGQILHMLQAINARVTRPARTVVFLAPGSAAGTTSFAWAYARAAGEVLAQRVLVLDASCSTRTKSVTPETPVVEDALVAGPFAAVTPAKPTAHIFTSRLISEDAYGQDVLSTVTSAAFWRQIREPFDEVVIDCAAASRSPLGLAMAPLADAVVLVVEADRTRAPVAEKLLRELRALNANVVGAVLNRRRYYVPARIYDRL
jgi:Mrp family chromosome partitioning ATPase